MNAGLERVKGEVRVGSAGCEEDGVGTTANQRGRAARRKGFHVYDTLRRLWQDHQRGL
jgi:hypothetical protein